MDPLEQVERYSAHNYHPLPVVLTHGEGAWVTDADGTRYLDLLSAYSALNFGHRHPRLIEAAKQQMDRLTLTSRAFHNDKLGAFAEGLARLTGKDMVLPMNSGAEAVETAIKTARKWGYKVKGVPADTARIVVADGNFHGRTTTIVSFSTDPDARNDFGPFTPGFDVVPYGDIAALEQAITDTTVAFLVEPIQGEAGVVVPPEGYLAEALQLCRDRNVLFIADEIQSGMARTGKYFASEHFGLVPDMVLSAKGIAGGLPLAGVTGRAEIMDSAQPGGLGGTFGGNPVSAAAAIAVFEQIEQKNLLAEAVRIENALKGALLELQKKYPVIGDVRGIGAMIAIELVQPGTHEPNAAAVSAISAFAAQKGVLLLTAGTYGNVLRFLPSLAISDELLREALGVIDEAFESL